MGRGSGGAQIRLCRRQLTYNHSVVGLPGLRLPAEGGSDRLVEVLEVAAAAHGQHELRVGPDEVAQAGVGVEGDGHDRLAIANARLSPRQWRTETIRPCLGLAGTCANASGRSPEAPRRAGQESGPRWRSAWSWAAGVFTP